MKGISSKWNHLGIQKNCKVHGLQRKWEVLLQRCFSFSHKSQQCDACTEDEFHQYPFQAAVWPLPQPFQFHLSLSTHWPLSSDLAIKQSIVVAWDATRASWGLDSTLPIHWPLLWSEPQEVTPEIRLKIDRFSCNPQSDLTSEFTFLNLTMSCQLTPPSLCSSCTAVQWPLSPLHFVVALTHTPLPSGVPQVLYLDSIPILLPALHSLLSSPPP